MEKILLLFSLLLFISCWTQSEELKKTTQQEINTFSITKNVEWNSMEPLIKNGWEVLFNSGFYQNSNGTAELSDIILYDFKGEKHPIIKSIVARDSDTVELKKNTLFVNNIEVKNSVWESYKFSLAEQKMMGLYIKENKIPKNSVFILWDNVRVSRDSRKFGAVSMNDILWKVQLKK